LEAIQRWSYQAIGAALLQVHSYFSVLLETPVLEESTPNALSDIQGECAISAPKNLLTESTMQNQGLTSAQDAAPSLCRSFSSFLF
jgi:hypothetical protein